MLAILISEKVQETFLELRIYGLAIFPSKAVVAQPGM